MTQPVGQPGTTAIFPSRASAQTSSLGWTGMFACVLATWFPMPAYAQAAAAVPPPGGSVAMRLTLHDAIAAAESSPTARAANAQVDAARGMVKQGGLRPNPRLFLQSEDLRPWADNFDFANNTEDYGYLSETIETAGKRGKRLDLARAEVNRAEAESAQTRQAIAGRVAESYWAAAASAKTRDLLQQDLAAVDAMVRYHQQRVDAGAMRGVDLLRMQVERDRVYIALQAARRDAEVARIELFRQMGRAPAASVDLVDDISTVEPAPAFSVDQALAQRPDVIAAQDAVVAAEADMKLQKSLGKPDPDLLGGYKRNSGDNTVYAALQIPLPFGNRNQGEVRRAAASIEVARAQLEQVRLMVRADIDAAQEDYQRQGAIVRETLPDMRGRARKNLDILTDAYRSGGVDLLRYIDAERTEIDVEVNALRELASYHQAVLRLELAYGVQP